MSDGRLARRSETREQLHRSAVRRSAIRVCLLRALPEWYYICMARSLSRSSNRSSAPRLASWIHLGVTGRRDTSISRDSPFLSFSPSLPPRASSALYLNSLRAIRRARRCRRARADYFSNNSNDRGTACDRTQSVRGGLSYTRRFRHTYAIN